MKKIFVLLSTYNGQNYLCEQIDSILSQENVKIHILIRDDGSTDDTPKILEKYERKYDNITVFEEKNIGCKSSFAQLMKYAQEPDVRVDYYAFADQDDIWLPNKLASAIEMLDKEDNINIPVLYCSNLKVVDEKLNFVRFKYPEKDSFVTKGESLVCSMSTGCTMVFNRTALDMFLSKLPEDFIMHDLWMLHTCIFLGKVVYDKDAYILYRQHGENVIGATMSLKDLLRRKIKSIRTIYNQHGFETEARCILKAYSNDLNDEDKKLVAQVANYRNTAFAGKIKFLFSPTIKRKHNNFILVMRIIIGRV